MLFHSTVKREKSINEMIILFHLRMFIYLSPKYKMNNVWETSGLTFCGKSFQKRTRQKDKGVNSIFLHCYTIILPHLDVSQEIIKFLSFSRFDKTHSNCKILTTMH